MRDMTEPDCIVPDLPHAWAHEPTEPNERERWRCALCTLVRVHGRIITYWRPSRAPAMTVRFDD